MLTANAAGEVSLPAGQRENICTRLNTHRPHKQMVSPRARTHTQRCAVNTWPGPSSLRPKHYTRDNIVYVLMQKHTQSSHSHDSETSSPSLQSNTFFLSSSSCFLFTVSEVQSYSGPRCSFTPSELSHPHTAALNPLWLTRTCVPLRDVIAALSWAAVIQWLRHIGKQ